MTPIPERVYTCVWHIGLAALGLYEYRRTHRTVLGKVLALGMTAFHVDAAISDALDTPCLTRQMLEKLKPRRHVV
jgi:hypothetical protein